MGLLLLIFGYIMLVFSCAAKAPDYVTLSIIILLAAFMITDAIEDIKK